MKENTLELVFLLDRSGSMAGLEKDTMGGFNSMLKKQKNLAGNAFVTTLLFDHQVQVLHDRLPLLQVPPMEEKDYWVRGSTALLDALGGAIRHIQDIHKYIRPQDVPTNTLFVITTDGMENASRSFSAAQVKAMVEAQKEAGWEFLFLGANMDAIETAAGLGISRDRAVDYCSDPQGTDLGFGGISEAVSDLRCCRPLSASWKQNIEKDHAARSGRKKA